MRFPGAGLQVAANLWVAPSDRDAIRPPSGTFRRKMEQVSLANPILSIIIVGYDSPSPVPRVGDRTCPCFARLVGKGHQLPGSDRRPALHPPSFSVRCLRLKLAWMRQWPKRSIGWPMSGRRRLYGHRRMTSPRIRAGTEVGPDPREASDPGMRRHPRRGSRHRRHVASGPR